MSPRWRVCRVGSASAAFGPFWVAYQRSTKRSEVCTSFLDAFRFAEAAAAESWGYRA